MAENLNEYFSSVFTREDISILPVLETKFEGREFDYLGQLIVTPTMVAMKIRDMKDNKSPGVDGIPPKLLLEIVEQISIPLATVCNLSLEEGIVPLEWKEANIIPLFKKVFRKIKSDADRQHLQDDLNKLIEWSEKWQMLFNFGKCKCLHTGHGNEDAQYTMGDTVLNTTSKEKDLGLTISADMKVSEQCGIAAAKGNQILGLIRRNIVYKEKELIIPLYKTIVRPHLEYCIQAWRPYRKKDIDMLERVQRRATKMIPKLRNISYEMRLKECGLTTLETRRLRGDQIEVFKILNGYENIDRNIFFTVKEERRTRGHGVTLAKKQCRLDIRKFSFSQRTVNEWNRLSADCVGASSVNIFKNKIDIYLRRAGYT